MKDGDSVHIIVVDQDSWVVRGFRCGAKQKCIGIDYKSSSSSEISPNTKNRWASLFSVVKVLKMGKKRVELKRIQNPSSRHATFSKRKSGLLKKAFELSVLCDAEVALIIFSETSKIYEFASNNDMTTILGKYRIHEESSEMSITTSLQNSKIHDQSGFNKLQEKFNILQKKQKNMAGEDLELLTMKELQRLEKQLQSGVKKICDRKMRIFSQNSKLLMQKVRSLEEENKKLHTELSTRGDSSTSALENASVHQTNLHLGLNAGPSKPCEGTGDGDHSHIVETDISNS